MDDLANLRFDEFLRRVAEKAPSPGGGSVAGAAGALACALGQMVTSYSVGSKTDAQTRDRQSRLAGRLEAALTSLHRLAQISKALVTQDAAAYEAMTTASKHRGESDAAAGAYQEAVLAAVAVPMEIAAVSSRALTTMDEMKEVANPYLLSDLAIAAVLADATARSARYLVQLNAAELTDNGRQTAVLAEIDQTVEHCDTRRGAIEAFVCDRLEIKPAGNR